MCVTEVLTGFVRAVASWIIRSVLGDKMFATMLEATRVKPVKEYLTFVKRRDNFEKLFYADVSPTSCFLVQQELEV